jgi:hypothetical protein
VQAELVNMGHLLKVEQALIEAVKDILPPEGYEDFTNRLAELLDESAS